MILTSGSRRRVLSRLVAFLAAVELIAASCAPRTLTVPPAPDPVPVVPTPTPVERPPLLILVGDSATYDVVSSVVTVEESDSGAIRDSASYTEVVRAVLTPDSTTGFRLVYTSDSGYVLPLDRSPPPETVRATKNSVTVTHAIASDGVVIRIPDDSTQLCSSVQSLVSPLVGNVTARYLSISSSIHPRPIGSLEYATCNAGVIREVVGTTQTVEMRDEATNRPSLVLLVKGTIGTDSTRALPMRISGTMEGRTAATPDSGIAVLPAILEIELTSSLVAASSVKSQAFRQQVTTRFVKRR